MTDTSLLAPPDGTNRRRNDTCVTLQVLYDTIVRGEHTVLYNPFTGFTVSPPSLVGSPVLKQRLPFVIKLILIEIPEGKYMSRCQSKVCRFSIS